MNDLPPDKIEFVDDMLNPHLTTPVAAVSDAPFEHADQSEQNPKQQQTFNLPLEISKVEPVGIERKDTLYNRLHSSNKKPIVKFMTAQQIVQALSRLSKTNTHIALFSRFSSHSSHPRRNRSHTTLAPSLTQAAVSTQRSVGSGAEKARGEGFELLRWRAPEATAETGEPTKEFDARRAVVFSLGLVLFEIETGAVPHGEIDALNASRQMKSGILPRMELVKDCELKELIDPPQTRFKYKPNSGQPTFARGASSGLVRLVMRGTDEVQRHGQRARDDLQRRRVRLHGHLPDSQSVRHAIDVAKDRRGTPSLAGSHHRARPPAGPGIHLIRTLVIQPQAHQKRGHQDITPFHPPQGVFQMTSESTKATVATLLRSQSEAMLPLTLLHPPTNCSSREAGRARAEGRGQEG
ncbi:hypothetical protein BLNAU_19358 [Blattamonas nauphoetae]|uniref:Protein kinase domain-containing protein n=1 Tax=Blattamonas nauphoetae TaxID=2049346 RepID=A0ABQ9X1P7_9EUKA|nr:hypothetical protein BLNAU_19358 [Blattamonas nauphoetae]